MSTEAGTAEGTGPPDRLLEDSTSEDTAESVYRRERELESTSSKPVIPTAEVTVIKLGRGGSDTGGVGEGGSPNPSGQLQEDDRMEEEEEEDISERARRYIAKKKEEAKAHIRALFADKINTYEAIKRHNLRSMAVSNLLGGLAIDQQMDSDLFAGGDGRICKTIVRADFGAKINASYSFKPSTMQCLGCQPRHQLATGTRAVFVLSDQDFPPALPCQNGGKCLFIFRMENGSLSELVDDFLEMTKGWRLPPGSVAIAISISQLSRCGTAAYAASLAHNGSRIQKAFSGNVEWIPGVPILACGSNNKELQLDPLCSARFSHHPGWDLWPTVRRDPLQPD